VAPDWLGDQENAAMLSDRRSTGRFVTSLKLCHLVRLMANTPTALVLLVSEASYAAQRTIEWFSEESCRYKIRFDPKKNDVTRIKNTCVVSDTTKNLFSANNFIRAGYRLCEPRHPWGWSNTLYWQKPTKPFALLERGIRR
jgi:hypothetical protein